MKNVKKILFSVCFIICICMFISCKKKAKTVTIGTKTLDVSKTYNIYIAQSADNNNFNEMRKGFVVGMKDLGMVEDINIKYFYENAKGNVDFANQIADAVIEKKPDIVLSIGDKVTKAIFDKDKNVVGVFLGCANSKEIGLSDKSDMPLGNFTGVRDSQLIKETLENIKEKYSNIKKLGIIYDDNSIMSKYSVDYFKFYATAYDIDIYTVSIKKSTDIEKALENIMPKVDALALVDDDMVVERLPKIMEVATNENKIVFGRDIEQEKLGCVVLNKVDYQLVGKKGAELVYDILVNGKKVQDIKIEDIDFK